MCDFQPEKPSQPLNSELDRSMLATRSRMCSYISPVDDRNRVDMGQHEAVVLLPLRPLPPGVSRGVYQVCRIDLQRD